MAVDNASEFIRSGMPSQLAKVVADAIGESVPPGAVVVENGDSIPIKTNLTGTAVVAGGAITGVTLPGVWATVENGDSLDIPVTGVYSSTVDFTVVNGEITAIELS
jgi:hypothetical protein